jgi:hypothetical protein
MGKEARNKGANGERDVVKIARSFGLRAERTAPLQAGSSAHSDVVIQYRGFEVKRCETLRMSEWLAKSNGIIFRRSKEPWNVVIPLDEYLGLVAGA